MPLGLNYLYLLYYIKYQSIECYFKIILQHYQREFMMQTIQESIDNIIKDQRNNNHIDQSDLQAEDLFNQIQLDEVHENGEKINNFDDLQNPFSNHIQEEKLNSTPKKLKKTKKLQLDSNGSIDDRNNQEQFVKKLKKNKSQKKDKKQRKLQKKLKKKLKKERKQKELKKLRKQGQQRKDDLQQSNNQQWSGQSQQSQQQHSDVSSDSLLERLNPKKLKNKSSNKKQQSVEKKQGFNLKQLGNDAEVVLQKQSQSDDQSYDNKNKKNKKRLEKKQIPKNQNMLRQLLDIGMCQQQQSEQQDKQRHNYDDGLQQILNMKNSKKKGPKISNKLFADMQIKDDQENNEPIKNLIQLQVKPRISSGPSSITSSFLSKAEKIKKSRGMQSQMQNEEYQKIITSKAKQSMSKLINRKELQQADEIELDVKVPQVVKGRVELNNSIFLKRTASETFNNDPNSASAKKKQQMPTNKNNIKISRFDLFRSISTEVKTRKSKDVTHQIIKNSFKVTQLQEIEQMRKKNQQKRRKQALRGSDDQQWEQEDENKQAKAIQEEQIIKPHNLNFLNFKIQVEDSKKQLNGNNENGNENIQQLEAPKQNKEISIVPQASQQNEQTNKSRKFKIELQNAISDKQYKKLLQLQQGQGLVDQQQGDEDVDKLLQLQDDNSEEREQQQERDLDHMELQYGAEQQQSKQQQNEKGDLLVQLKNAQKVELQVDLEVSHGQNLSQSSSSSQQQQIQQKEPANPQYQQYLKELEEQGINIKNNISRISKQNYMRESNEQLMKDYSEKQNNQLIQNSQNFSQTNNNASNSKKSHIVLSSLNYDEARKQFKKLRKIATIIKSKKKRIMRTQRAGEFYEQQAEQGSDNQEHDGQIKKINDDDEAKQYEGLDLDADLEQLIDNAVDINQQNEQLAFQKYMEDDKIQDRQWIRRIMNGDFKRRDDQQGMMDEMQQDEKRRLKRMEEFEEYMKKRDLQDGQDLYVNEEVNSNLQSNDNSQNEQKKRQMKEANKVQLIQQQVQQMNEQNLKRYLDDCLLDSYRPTKIVTVVKPILLPQSYQRIKKTQMRNTMKSKQIFNQQMKPLKLKKTSSHLNQLIMKNKQKVKPLSFSKNMPMLKFGKK